MAEVLLRLMAAVVLFGTLARERDAVVVAVKQVLVGQLLRARHYCKFLSMSQALVQA